MTIVQSSSPSPHPFAAWSTAFVLFSLPYILDRYLRVPAFSPRAVVYSNDLLAVLTATIAKPDSLSDAVSRLLQCTVWAHVGGDPPLKAFGVLEGTCIILACIRTASGYLLTRSVGWAYPALFSHWALYETSTGFGAALVAYLILVDPHIAPSPLSHRAGGYRWSALKQGWTTPALVGILCWLECRPWTYGTALVFSLPVGYLYRLYCASHQMQTSCDLPVADIEKQKLDDTNTSSHSIFPPRAAASLLAVLVPWFVLYHLVPPTRMPLPVTKQPLVDILLLSYPRPVSLETSIGIINSTVASYLPYLSPAVSLSLFTHSTDHQALRVVHDFASLSSSRVSLRIDDVSHSDERDGHYLHLAEAFRWIAEDAEHTGEWIMLVEDDFTICDGEQGWAVITTVLNKLELDRQVGHVRSGFVGTGGSGIIVHRSYLPTLIALLRTRSAIASPLHPDMVNRLPDQVIHECILGRPHTICERQHPEDSKLLISSRLVLDHIGGMATTTPGKMGNSDKWRCGWRHAFHGDEMVEVVVV